MVTAQILKKNKEPKAVMSSELSNENDIVNMGKH